MSYNQLTENERYQIDAFIKAGLTQKEIADQLGRSPSTISRELKRNRGLRGYRPTQAQRLSDGRRVEASKAIKLTDEVKAWIDQLIRQELSPQQVADYLLRLRRSYIVSAMVAMIEEEKSRTVWILMIDRQS